MGKYKKNYKRKRYNKKKAVGRKIRKNGMLIMNPNRSYLGSSNNLKTTYVGRGLPQCIRGVLPVAETFGRAPAGTALDLLTLHLNDLHDPWGAFASEQPWGYDKLGALYRAYYVYGATVSIKILNTSNIPIEAGFLCTGNESLSSADIGKVEGAPYSAVKFVPVNSPAAQWKFYVDNYRVCGLKNQRLHQNNPFVGTLAGSGASGSPGLKAYLQIFTQNSLGSGTATCSVHVCIDYHYCMFDLQVEDMIDA